MKEIGVKTRVIGVKLPPVMRDLEQAFRGRRDELVGKIIREWVGRYGNEPAQGTFGLYVICHIPVPEGADRYTRVLMVSDLSFPKEGPDASVIACLVLDALTGVAFHNTAQIAETHVYRKYADEPKITVLLTEIKTRPYTVYHGGVIEAVSVFDREETVHGCAVQILENSVLGNVSVGWWKEDGEE